MSRISVEGNELTLPYIIEQELPFSEGDILGEDKLTEAEANLRRLGIFANVSIRSFTDSAKPTSKVVVVNVTEGEPGAWGAGVGGRNDLGARVFGSVGYGNLWKRNHAVQLNGSVNYRVDQTYCAIAPCFLEYQLGLTYNWPHLLVEGLTLRPRVAAENIRYISFDAFAQSASMTLERRMLKVPNVTVALDYRIERITQSNASIEDDNRTLRIGSLTPSVRLDLRDNPLVPTKGFFTQTSFEWASTALGSQTDPFPVGYTRFQIRADGHIPLGRSASFYLSFRSGFARNLEPPPNPLDSTSTEYAIPLSKQFVLGGAGSIRGFRERAIRYDNLAIRGTLSYVNYRFQLDLPFLGAFRVGPFLDAGNLHVDGFSFGDLRWGSGVGVRYLSPVGPVNFDLGFNLFPRPNEASPQLYFSIGVI